MHQVFQQWKLIPGHEIQYLVCDRGFIFSFVKNGYLDPSPNQYGYYAVTLWKNGVSHQIKVHQIVAAAFIGPCPDGMEVNHKDGNKLNNSVSNLEYVTKQENTQHAVETGLMHWGERSPHSKLTNQQAKEIRERYTTRQVEKVMEIYGLSRRTAYRVLAGESYRHAV